MAGLTPGSMEFIIGLANMFCAYVIGHCMFIRYGQHIIGIIEGIGCTYWAGDTSGIGLLYCEGDTSGIGLLYCAGDTAGMGWLYCAGDTAGMG